MAHPIDVALQSVTPTYMVPRYAELEELNTSGQRILMGSNGVWLEVFRPWLYVRTQIAKALPIPVPYGEVSPVLRMTCGKLPLALVSQFVEVARTRSPNECAAWIVWNEHSKEWKFLMLEETSVSPGHVSFICPDLDEGEHLVVDLHSHGLTEAFFSRTDNKDDAGAVKVSGVIGNLNKEEVTTAFRLCAGGVFLKLPFDSPIGQKENL